jgi:hypothetical protein
MVAAVAALDPDVAANIAQAPMFACMSPPGSHESQWVIAPYMRSAMPERSRISPIMMNSGMVTMSASAPACQLVSPMARIKGAPV